MTNEKFEPRILSFCCNWCSYAGADLAGVSRLQMPAHFRTIRVMCSSRVNPVYVVTALRRGRRDSDRVPPGGLPLRQG